MVFYLKYRPQVLDELDNFEARERIKKFLSRPSIPHAFLFTGPKGTGKTSTARIVAKSLNCQNKKDGQACGKCDVCKSIARGDSMDILEIDAASNRGIDEIRELREKIKLSPIELDYKVYIIDEVHMLTTEAFNALLKTIEEPPQHAVFILATTEVHKVPDTIVSRCIHVDFHKATEEEIVHALKRIVAGEKLKVEDSALLELAKNADGSFRDAAKLLEEVAADKSQVTLESVRRKLGSSDITLVEEFMVGLKAKKAKELLHVIQKLSEEGKNVRQFFLTLLHRLEKLLINSYEDKETDWQKTELVKAINIFAKSFAELKTAVIDTLPFELAVVEYCEGELEKNVSNEKIPVYPKTTVDSNTTVTGPVPEKWDEILESLKAHNHSIVGVLRSCRPLQIAEGVLSIETAYKFHAERLAEPKVQALIAKAVKDVVGLDVKVQTFLKNRL